jgi:tetratricopeptide (TPR) repeat protein
MIRNLSAQEIADQARQMYQAGNYLQAAKTFSEAASAFENSGDSPMSAEMKNNQSVAFLLAGDARSALNAVEGTEIVFADSRDFRRQGMALANQASALEALGQTKDAIEYYKKAAEALEQANEGDLRAGVMQLLASLYLRHFKIFDAIITLQSSLVGVKNPSLKQRLMKKILFIRLGR